MSELPPRITEIPVVPPGSTKGARLRATLPSFTKRLTFILAFILVVFGMLALMPQLAQQIAYSWNVGAERAKAEVARGFLADNPLAAVEQRTVWVAKAVSPSVVGIRAIIPLPPEARGRGRADSAGIDHFDGIGSGVVVDAQGYILTNSHVVASADIILVRLSDGREVEAIKVGQDSAADLAVLRINMDDLEAIPWGDSRQAVVGEQVVAIGSPYNLQQTVTSGIISATERYSPVLSAGGGGGRRGNRRSSQEFLQTDAAINPGNSGGALVDMNGKLIGICTAIYSQSGGNSGIGFAIPSFVAKRIYDEIVSHGQVQHGWLGVDYGYVTAFQSQQMKQKKPTGAVITRVRSGSPAMEASLKRGDIILKWGETEINDPLQLSHMVLLAKPGTQETVEVFRDGELLNVDITVGVRPTDL